MNNVVVVGTVVCEEIISPHGTSVPPHGLGGSAVYAAIGAQFVHPAALIGIVGTDSSNRFKHCLDEFGVDRQGLEQTQSPTFFWKAEYDATDISKRVTLDLRLGAYENYQPIVPASCLCSKFWLLANLDPDLQKSVLLNLGQDQTVVLGTIEHWIMRKRASLIALLKMRGVVHGFIANEEEMLLLAGTSDPMNAIRAVAGLGCRFVVMTRAERGAAAIYDGRIFEVPAYACAAVDPSGAGDSFAGAMTASLARSGGPITEEALRLALAYGSAVASFCVERFGVQGFRGVNCTMIDSRVKHIHTRITPPLT